MKRQHSLWRHGNMKRELEDKLKEDFPSIFRDLYDSKPTESCLCDGIECSNGWYQLVHDLCTEIMKLYPSEDFKAEQVKEKFGGLRFYVSGSTADINNVIDDFEEKSYHVCESCGSEDQVECKGRPYWVTTLCAECAKPNEN